MNELIHSLIFDDIVDTNNHTLKGDFGDTINEYCRQHSQDGDGKYDEFSRVPFHCSCEIAIDVIEKTIEHIKSKFKKWQ